MDDYTKRLSMLEGQFSASQQSALQKEQLALEKQRNADAFSIASDFANMAGSAIDYSLLQGNIQNYKTQANAVELQAKQRANLLREQFTQNVGSYTFGATRRGVDVKSGSVQKNITSSAEALSKDLQMQDKEAQMQAKVLRSQAKMQKTASTANLITSITGSAASAYSTYKGGL